jgi:prepilin-type N-terminal cleavage/methylation domain-containing protein/prepilin-type processing-associated H-X9-DG protein
MSALSMNILRGRFRDPRRTLWKEEPGMCRPSRPWFGFTLIELLVVVAIIAILAVVLFPVFAQAREKARQTTCLSNMQQLARAQLIYLQDWDEHLPHWWEYGPSRPEPYGAFTFWTEYFQPYLRDAGVFHCPSFAWGPGGPDTGEKLADYALFTWGPSGRGTPDDPYWRWAGPPLTLAQVNRPSETFNVMDGSTTTLMTRGLIARHSEGMNTGLLDGHARWITRDQAFAVTKDEGGEYYYRYISADRG